MQKSKVQIHNGKFTRQKFPIAFLNGKIRKAKIHKAKSTRQNSAQQIFARAERVPHRGGSRVNHTLPARFVRW
jgi:hypothetical protein